MCIFLQNQRAEIDYYCGSIPEVLGLLFWCAFRVSFHPSILLSLYSIYRVFIPQLLLQLLQQHHNYVLRSRSIINIHSFNNICTNVYTIYSSLNHCINHISFHSLSTKIIRVFHPIHNSTIQLYIYDHLSLSSLIQIHTTNTQSECGVILTQLSMMDCCKVCVVASQSIRWFSVCVFYVFLIRCFDRV